MGSGHTQAHLFCQVGGHISPSMSCGIGCNGGGLGNGFKLGGTLQEDWEEILMLGDSEQGALEGEERHLDVDA